jgi:hypothetical protein
MFESDMLRCRRRGPPPQKRLLTTSGISRNMSPSWKPFFRRRDGDLDIGKNFGGAGNGAAFDALRRALPRKTVPHHCPDALNMPSR